MLAPYFRWNQKTRKDWTTKPPPKESTANSAASRLIVRRDPVARRDPPIREASSALSTAGESRIASAMHAAAITGNARRKRWLAGSDGNTPRNAWGPPAASAPPAPARHAMALYRPNTRTRLDDGARPIMPGSREQIRPDSLRSA